MNNSNENCKVNQLINLNINENFKDIISIESYKFNLQQREFQMKLEKLKILIK